MYLYMYTYRRSGTILQDVVVVQVVQVVFRTVCCGHTWVLLGVGWDENGMGWARYRYLGCTAFSDWEQRVVVVVVVVAEARGLDWTVGHTYLMFEGTR